MPTYEYACESCGKRYEKREGFDAPARQKCRHCGKPANRVLFAPPVVFKGSGFYKTDSRGSTGGDATPAPASTTASEPSSSSADSAPAATESAAAS